MSETFRPDLATAPNGAVPEEIGPKRLRSLLMTLRGEQFASPFVVIAFGCFGELAHNTKVGIDWIVHTSAGAVSVVTVFVQGGFLTPREFSR